MIYRLLLDSSLNRPVYSGSLFCRLLKQTAKGESAT